MNRQQSRENALMVCPAQLAGLLSMQMEKVRDGRTGDFAADSILLKRGMFGWSIQRWVCGVYGVLAIGKRVAVDLGVVSRLRRHGRCVCDACRDRG